MLKYKKDKRFVAFSLLTLAVILSSGAGCGQRGKQVGQPEKVTIAYSTAFNTTLVHIAFKKGYFKEEGLDAIPQPHAFGKLALQAVLEGTADIATAGDTPIMFAIMNGKLIKIIAVIETANRNSGIVARRDRGLLKPSDLKGKRIGVTRGTSGDFFTAAFLIDQGIDEKQVTIVDLNPRQNARSFRDKEGRC